jgi:DNA-binding NtrC family response regulator
VLDEIRNQITHIILSDLNMPGVSGFELLSAVCHRLPSIRVIAMSGTFSGDAVPPELRDVRVPSGSNTRTDSG